MRRRSFVSGAAVAAVGALAGAGGTQAMDTWAGALVDPAAWRSTLRPDPSRGSATVFWSGDVRLGRVMAVTFDDGPTEQFTGRVLDALATAGVRATFFVIGELAQRFPDLVRRARDEGHEIANHSFDHGSASDSDRERVRAGVLRGSDVIEALTGDRPRWFRPPRGQITTATLLAAREAGLDLAMWSVDRGGAADRDSSGVASHLAASTLPGGIVDLHDGIGRSVLVGAPDRRLVIRRRAEIQALPAALARWAQDDYQMVTLSQLIPTPPSTPASRSRSG